MRSVVMLRVIYAECRKQTHYAECHYAECRYVDCRYAECRGPCWKGLPGTYTNFFDPFISYEKSFIILAPDTFYSLERIVEIRLQFSPPTIRRQADSIKLCKSVNEQLFNG